MKHMFGDLTSVRRDKRRASELEIRLAAASALENSIARYPMTPAQNGGTQYARYEMAMTRN